MVEMSSASIAGGDLEVQKILDSPDIDYLSGPFSYTVAARKMGGSGEFRCVYDSIRLHQKLWLSETDQASNLGTPFNDTKIAHTDAETIALNRRNFAYVLTHGAGIGGTILVLKEIAAGGVAPNFWRTSNGCAGWRQRPPRNRNTRLPMS